MSNFILGFVSCVGLMLLVLYLVTGMESKVNNRINACLLDAVTQEIITIEQEKALEELLNKNIK